MIVATLVALTTLSLTTHANASTVKVKTGDTVSGLAEKHHTSVGNIIKWNHLKDKNLIVVGDKLNIDGKNIEKIDQRKKTVQQHVTTVSQQPVQSVQQAPVQQTQPVQQTNQNVQNNVQPQEQSQQNMNAGGNSAKEQIAYGESRGSYTAQNGRYYGRYQLDLSYLGGDLSPQHQEEVFQQYCNDRYGSVQNALSFRQQNGWY